MNDEEEVVVVSSQEQPQEQPQETRTKNRQPLNERAQEGINNVGKTMENVGRAEEKIADWIDGGEKTTKTATNVGDAATSVAEKGTDIAEKTAAAKERIADAAEKAAKGIKTAGQATETAGKATKTAGQATETAGQVTQAAGTAATAIPYAGAAIGGTLKGIGGAEKGTGAGMKTAGAATEATGKATKATGEAAEKTAKAEKAAAKAEKASAKAAKTSAKAAKTGTEAAKKASDKSFADKLRERGRLHQKQGKRLQDLSNKFDSKSLADDAFDKLGKGKNVLKGIFKIFDPKVFGVLLLLILIVGTILVFYVMSPMFFINQIVSLDSVEKSSNFIKGLGFKDSEQAFYDEVNYLKTHYSDELDFPYIMSTLYYTDIFYGNADYIDVYNGNKVCDFLDKNNLDDNNFCDQLIIGVRSAEMWLKELRTEATTTTGANGLTYSANKIYRMRELAKHQFLGDDEEKEASLSEYIELCRKRIGNEFSTIMEYAPYIALYVIAYAYIHSDPTLAPLAATLDTALVTGMTALIGGSVFNDITDLLHGTENWTSIMTKAENGGYGGVFGELVYDLGNLFEILYNCIFKISGIDLDIDTGAIVKWFANSVDISDDGVSLELDDIDISDVISIKIKYYDYSYDEEKFEEYLINEYIKKMPEFSKLLLGPDGKKLTGDDLDKKIKNIAAEIKYLKDLFDSIYEKDESAQKYGTCIGDIDLDLLTELTPPVKLTIGQRITFSESNNYGFQKGIVHKGVDLEEESTDTKEGDEVYSIYTGVVSESTVDGTYEGNVNGGWLAIDYTVQYSNSKKSKGVISQLFKSKLSKIKVYYGGLNPETLTLKQGDIVEKGEVIGHVGTAANSETGEKPSVHFAIYDTKKNVFLNPVNMFITCRKINPGSCTNGGTTLELPSSVFDLYQTNYTITFYDERGFGSLGIDPHSPQKKVHQLWLDDGLRFKNGIAIVNVDGVDRYLAAVTKNFGAVGDLVYANLEDGTALPLIIADEKDYDNTNNDGKVDDPELCMSPKATDPACYGHLSGKSLSVIEFEFDNQYLYKGFTSATQLEQEWNTNQKVISISNCGSTIE